MNDAQMMGREFGNGLIVGMYAVLALFALLVLIAFLKRFLRWFDSTIASFHNFLYHTFTAEGRKRRREEKQVEYNRYINGF